MWESPSQECPALIPQPANTKATHSPGVLAQEHTPDGFVIYNVRPTNKFYYSNMWSKPKERGTFKLIFCSKVTFAMLFTFFSLFHHRGTVFRNYYVKQYIKKWVWVFWAINNGSHLFKNRSPHSRTSPIICLKAHRLRHNGEPCPDNTISDPGITHLPWICSLLVPMKSTRE